LEDYSREGTSSFSFKNNFGGEAWVKIKPEQMKYYLVIFSIGVLLTITANAQNERIYMWYNGDENKPFPAVLLATDSLSFKKDTIGAACYLISSKEFFLIRSFFLKDSLGLDEEYKSAAKASYDFSIFGGRSLLYFFTDNLKLVKVRLDRILEILKDNPLHAMIGERFNSIYLRLRGKSFSVLDIE
jgi:hypothetical protein